MARFQFTDFKEAFQNGVRPNLFEFSIIPEDSSFNMSTMKFLCTSTAIPALTITPKELSYKGRKVFVPGDLTFSALTTTIINDDKYTNLSILTNWFDKMNEPDTAIKSMDNTRSTGQIIQYTQEGSKLATYKFIDMFPSAIAAIALDSGTASDVENIEVTWSYNYYEATINNGTGSTYK